MKIAFNGNDFEYYRLTLLEDNHFVRFKKRRELIQVTGRNGDLIIEDGSYDNLELYLKFLSENDKNFEMQEVFTDLENWLDVGEYGTLEFEDGYIFSAKFLEITDIKQIFKNDFEFTIKFTCKKI